MHDSSPGSRARVEVPREGLPIGRAAFLGTILAGVGGIAVAPSVASFVNGAANELPAGLGSLVPGGGWRIYSIVTPLPEVRSRHVRAAHPRRGREPGHAALARGRRADGRESDLDVPLRHRLDRLRRALGGDPRLARIADLVRPKPSARYVTFQSLEAPYVDQLTRAQFELKDTMLARHMNGKPVTREHGAPLRLVVPQMYGYKGVKWLAEIRYDTTPRPASGSSAATTSTPGSGARMASRHDRDPALHAHRARRALAAREHLLRDARLGLALYLPSLSNIVARPTAKAWHLWSAAVLGIGLVALVALGNRRALGRTARDLERLDGDDVRWLTGGPKRFVTGEPAPPQGRFNAGQKLNAAITLGLMIVMAVTGLLLWYGEQDTQLRSRARSTSTTGARWILILLVAGHMYLAVLHPATRHALRGMTVGDVDREWAAEHHAKWVK